MENSVSRRRQLRQFTKSIPEVSEDRELKFLLDKNNIEDKAEIENNQKPDEKDHIEKEGSMSSIHSYDSQFSVHSITEQALLEEFEASCINNPLPVLFKQTPVSFKKIPWAPIAISAVAEFSRTILASEFALAAEGKRRMVPVDSRVAGGFKFWNIGSSHGVKE
jgi:hypothetical protein